MISYITKIFKNVFSKSFSKNYSVEGVLTAREKSYVLVVSKKDDTAFFIPKKSNNSFELRHKIATNFIDVKDTKENLAKCSHFRFTFEHGYYVATYVRSSFEKDRKEFITAKSKDLKVWKILSAEKTISSAGVIIPHLEHYNEKMLAFGGEGIGIAHSSDYKGWKIKERRIASKRKHLFDDKEMTVINVLNGKQGIIVLYETSENRNHDKDIYIGALVLAKNNISHIIWRSDTPVWEYAFPHSKYPGIKLIGSNFEEHEIRMFYTTEKGTVISFTFPYPLSKKHIPETKGLTIEKHRKNPIISPNKNNEWESVATFNPAAICEDGRVHLFYRAHGPNGMSVIGYASSADGIHFDERSDEPVYVPRADFEGLHVPKAVKTSTYSSGYGWGGCEDPRVTKIDDKLYMLYAAYNGWEQARLAMSWISYEDFKAKRWNWSKPELMSPRPTVWGTGNKCGAILPEKINGKYVIFHRIWPNISIDYVDSLDFSSEDKWLEEKDIIPPRKTMWDSSKIGTGAPPLKTKYGWLVIYQSVGRDGKYKIGAMLLDLENPAKVICRTKKPILEPEQWYENEGLKGGVAYPCGSVIKDGKLFVYYGAADTVVCVASADLETFVQAMLHDKNPSSLITKLKIS